MLAALQMYKSLEMKDFQIKIFCVWLKLSLIKI